MYNIFYCEIEVNFYNAKRRKVETYFKTFKRSILFRGSDVFYEDILKEQIHKQIFTPKEQSYITDLNYKKIHSQGKPVYNPMEQTNHLNFIYHGSKETKHLRKSKI